METTDLKRRMLLIGILLAAFPGRQSGSAEGTAKAYMIAIDDCSVASLEAAVHRFIRGEAPGHNPAFPPSAAELARQCRLLAVGMAVEKRRNARELATPARAAIEYSTEHRREMAAKLRALAQQRLSH